MALISIDDLFPKNCYNDITKICVFRNYERRLYKCQ